MSNRWFTDRAAKIGKWSPAEQTDEPERIGLGELRNQLQMQPNLSPGYPKRSAVQETDSMRQPVHTFAITLSIVFVVITGWCMTVRGIFESTNVDVNSMHFQAGAGNWWLFLRAALAFLATLALWFAFLFHPPSRSRVPTALLSLALMPLFVYSAVGLERWAPLYSEQSFFELVRRHTNGFAVKKADVIASLGNPLVDGYYPNGTEVWCYTYMPSSGFGWNKRDFVFQGENVIFTAANSEP